MKRNKIFAILFALILCFPGCGNSQEKQEKQQALKKEGMQLQADGDYEAAIAKYEEALKLADMEVGAEEIDLAYYKASAQYRSGDISGAIDTYSAILAVKKDEDGYLGRGLLYAAAQEMDQAEKDLNKILEKSEDPLLHGIVYQALGKTDQAKECFELSYKTRNFDALFYLAEIYREAGDKNYAQILLENYIAEGDAGAETYLLVGRAYFEEMDYQNALFKFQDGIELGESGILKTLLQEEIACYEKLGEFESARNAAEKYLETYPEDTMIQKEYEFLKSR